jgi:serpin B
MTPDDRTNEDITADGGADEGLATLVAGTNDAAFDLLRELSDDENICLSPVGVALALAMADAGARGETSAQLHEALGLPDDVHEAFAGLQSQLADETTGGSDGTPFELSVADAVWGQDGYPFREAYLSVLDEQYDGGLQTVDYRQNPEDARERINAWVAGETGGHIEGLLPADSLDALTRLVLVTAVYFRASWRHPFEESKTSETTFTALDGTEQTVSMMAQDRTWAHAEHDGTRAVELPYVGGETSMLVVLPPAGEFEARAEEFDAETLGTLVDRLEPRRLELSLPRFEFEWGADLREAFEGLGAVEPFDPDAADFGGVADTDEPFALDGLYHETRLAVDEAGTEAAAATGATMGTVSIPPEAPDFTADRPFLCLIRDRGTGAVLFLARVVDPAGWE